MRLFNSVISSMVNNSRRKDSSNLEDISYKK